MKNKKFISGAAALMLMLALIISAFPACSPDESEQPAVSDTSVPDVPVVSTTDEPETVGFLEYMSGSVWYGYVGESIEPVITVSQDGAATSSYLTAFFFGEGAQDVSMRFYENADGSCGFICSQGDKVYDIPTGTSETAARVSDLYINDIQMYFYFADASVNEQYYGQYLFRADTGVNESLSSQIVGTWASEDTTFVFNGDVDPSTGFGTGEWNDAEGASTTLWATLGDNVIIFITDGDYGMPQTFAAVVGEDVLSLSRWTVYEGEIMWLDAAYPAVN